MDEEMSRRLDDTDLKNLLDAAERGFAHTLDIVRLVEEVKWYRRWMDFQVSVCGYDPRTDGDRYELDRNHNVVESQPQPIIVESK